MLDGVMGSDCPDIFANMPALSAHLLVNWVDSLILVLMRAIDRNFDDLCPTIPIWLLAHL